MFYFDSETISAALYGGLCVLRSTTKKCRQLFLGKKCIRVTRLEDVLTSKWPGSFTALAPLMSKVKCKKYLSIFLHVVAFSEVARFHADRSIVRLKNFPKVSHSSGSIRNIDMLQRVYHIVSDTLWAKKLHRSWQLCWRSSVRRFESCFVVSAIFWNTKS